MPEPRRQPDPNCPVCSKSSMGIRGCLVLDVLQVPAARRRWQWADLGPGANDCPGCIDLPPEEPNA
jgi:hypothetical protein